VYAFDAEEVANELMAVWYNAQTDEPSEQCVNFVFWGEVWKLRQNAIDVPNL
jgi:hypothetical protein